MMRPFVNCFRAVLSCLFSVICYMSVLTWVRASSTLPCFVCYSGLFEGKLEKYLDREGVTTDDFFEQCRKTQESSSVWSDNNLFINLVSY